MKIAQVATNVERVPPDGYGGTELVVHLLTEELVKRGHEVTLFASGDSETAARLVSTVDFPLRTDPSQKPTQWVAYDMATCLKVVEMQNQFDVVHNHLGYQAFPFFDTIRPVTLTTNHNAIKDYCKSIYMSYRHQPLISISESYRRLNYGDELNYAATIYNGIDVDAFANSKKVSRDYLLFIGRLSYDKGTAEAIDIAKALKMPIKIAGKIDKNDEPYFEAEVKPRLESYSEANYVGEVNHAQKQELYAGAKAVVYPINFDEPFGLVMVEALAAGTPIMALDRGSVMEILTPETAIVAKTTAELIERFPEVLNLRAEDCVERVRQCFSVHRMVDAYENVYKQLIEQKERATRTLVR